MKKNLRKLSLGRETLQKLDPTNGPRIAGGLTTVCTDSELESCGGTCATRCSGCCCI